MLANTVPALGKLAAMSKAIKRYYTNHKSGMVEKIDGRVEKTLQLVPEKGYRILDIGCNDGFLSKLLERDGNKVTGIEINRELALEAKQKISDVIIQDLEEPWQVDSNAFDMVHMGAVLEHLFDYHHLLNEANRVLKDDGTLIISVPNFGYLVHRLELLIGKAPRWYTLTFDHIRPWTKSWLKQVLEKHGFHPDTWVGAFIPNQPLLLKVAHHLPSLSSILICQANKVKNANVDYLK